MLSFYLIMAWFTAGYAWEDLNSEKHKLSNITAFLIVIVAAACWPYILGTYAYDIAKRKS